jgi:hypothetical protein
LEAAHSLSGNAYDRVRQMMGIMWCPVKKTYRPANELFISDKTFAMKIILV